MKNRRRKTQLFLVVVLAFTAVIDNSAGYAATKKKPVAGGANQVQGLTQGKIGQMLFDGHWRFQVLALRNISSYTMTVPRSDQDYAKFTNYADYDNASYTYTPKAGYTFVAIDCVAKNAQTRTENLDCYLNDPNTALTDDQSNSYQPIVMDMQTMCPWVSKALLPGSQEKITILFAVPPGTKPQDLVFTLKNWSDHKGHDVRVHLN